MAIQNEGVHAGEGILSEANGLRSRDEITVLAGAGADRALTPMMVLGAATKGAATPAAVAGNTGTGTIGAVTIGAATKPGVYRATCIAAAVNAGRFTIEDPDGIELGVADVGVAFAGGGLGFTIADGATDFVVGDAFTITVAAGSGKYVQLDLAGTDGTEDAAGILLAAVTAPNGVDAQGVAVVRDAVVRASALVWPAGASQSQKDAATTQLAAQGIITR